jgi:hypothetical protein
MAAIATNSVEKELMPGRAKSSGELGLHLCDASFEIEKLAALVAMEMVVMILSRDFISVGISGKRYDPQPLLGYQVLDVAVYRGNAQPRMMALGRQENLGWRQRPVCLPKSRANCRFLPCVALFHRC